MSNRWIIRAQADEDTIEGIHLYWTNEDGWNPVVAEVFTDAERADYDLPLGGEWCITGGHAPPMMRLPDPAPAPTPPPLDEVRAAVDRMQQARADAVRLARLHLDDLDLDPDSEGMAYLNEWMDWTPSTSLAPDALREAVESILYAGAYPSDLGLRECPY